MKTMGSKDQLIASVCRDSFADFVKRFWKVVVPEDPVWNWHIPYICDEMQGVAERVFLGLPRENDVIVNVSPGSSKSTIASIMFTPWVWTRMPHARIIGASYAYPLALDLSRKCRDVVRSDLYRACFPEIQLREDQDTKGYFANTKGGMRYAVGSGGSVTGMHGHFIVVDDPLDPNQAVSEAELNNTNHWMKETLSSRKIDKRLTPTFLIMQRLHQNDPTAQGLKKKRVKHICLPATLTDKVAPIQLRDKYKNGLFDPIRLPKDILEETRTEMGEYGYAGQYGQDPVPEGGGMFKTSMLRYDELVPKKWRRLVRYWDKAGTMGGGAYTVGILMGLDEDNRVWILDVVRVQLDSYSRERLVQRTARKDGIRVVVGLEQEPGSGGKESAETTVRRLVGYKVRVDAPKGKKETRADPFSVQVNGGNVYLGPDTGWHGEYVEEMKFFPYSTYKDQIDASSGGFALLARPRRRVGGMKQRG